MKNERLKSAEVFFENNVPYVKLVYEYENDEGVHELIYPKVEFPIVTYRIPRTDHRRDYSGLCFKEDFIIPSKSALRAFKGDVLVKENRDAFSIWTDIYFVDRITKPKVHEMTLEEIEKKLGYSVKIISKESKNG